MRCVVIAFADLLLTTTCPVPLLFVFVAQNNFGRADDGSLGHFNKGQADSENEESIESESSNEAESLFTQMLSPSVHSAADDDEASLDEHKHVIAEAENEESIESESSNEAESLFTQALSSVVHSDADDDESSLDEHNEHVVAEKELVVDEHVVAHMHDVAAPPDDEAVKEDRTTMSEEVRTEYSPAHVCPTGSITRINN
jgi:hypothetical protein